MELAVPESSGEVAGTIYAASTVITAGLVYAGYEIGAAIYDFAHTKKKQSTGKARSDSHDAQYSHGGKNRPKNPNKRKGAERRRLKGKPEDY